MRTARTSHSTAAAVLLAAAFTVAAADPDAAGGATPRPERQRAACNAWVHGSHATANCFNPYPREDRVQLHVECERWWDPDMHGKPVVIGPAEHVQVSERCWKEIRQAWVSYLR